MNLNEDKDEDSETVSFSPWLCSPRANKGQIDCPTSETGCGSKS